MKKLVAPKKLNIDFKPSPRQYELWKALQPNYCDKCGGSLEMKLVGYDGEGHEIYKPVCSKCGNEDIPNMVLSGGAAGGGKSFTGCCWIVKSCIEFPGIKMVIARKTLKMLKKTTWSTLNSVLKLWGFKENVNYHMNNVEGVMTFWNGSEISMLELSPSNQDPDYNSLGSLEITGAFIDEVSEICSKAVEVLASRMRWKVHETFIVPKLLMSTNPCLTWVRSRFVQDDNGDPVKLASGDRFIRFSVYDNPDRQFREVYVNNLLKIKDPYTRRRLLYGDWDTPSDNKNAAYHAFDGKKHVVTKLWEQAYNPLRPLILSWDFNVAPRMTCIAMQFDYENKKVYVLKEWLGLPKDKENNTPALARKIKADLLDIGHSGGIIITGDPAGKSRSTQTEDGTNNYTIAMDVMRDDVLLPQLKLFEKQPSHITRLQFINQIFEGYDGWEVLIDLRCRKLTEDFLRQMKNEDGTKEKKKEMVDGVRCEALGHASDCFDYASCYFLGKLYKKFKTAEVQPVTTYCSDSIYDNGTMYDNWGY